MVNMPMPKGLTLFMMVGNKAADLAGNIVISMQDHLREENQYAVSYMALVDDTFEKEKAVVDNVFYECDFELLESTAPEIAIQKIKDMNTVLNSVGNGLIVDRKYLNCVLVVDANDTVSFDKVAGIVEEIQSRMDLFAIHCEAFLCLLTDFELSGNQHRWLMKDGQLHNGMNLFLKMLLLSTQDYSGNFGATVEQNMHDVVSPALLLMIDRHELDNENKLYTAAYNNTGGTSNDILLLKRHIAAEVLDGLFARTDRFAATDVWNFLSTRDMDLKNGNSVEERVLKAAEGCVPSLECIAMTADLDDKDFNPIEHVMHFDEQNREIMLQLGTLPEKWENDILEKVKGTIYLDAVLAQLNEDSEVFKSIVAEWFKRNQRKKELKAPDYVKSTLQYIGKERGLFTKMRDYNLDELRITVNSYQRVCKERLAFRILSCLRDKIPLICEKLKKMIDRRKSILSQYMQSPQKITLLKQSNMCGRAADSLYNTYAKKDIEMLRSYTDYSEYLYQSEGEKYWRSIFQEFVGTEKRIVSFADAFLQNKNSVQLRNSVEELGNSACALIPDYPVQFGPLPTPTTCYFLQESIANSLDTNPNYTVFSVPGDVVEHVALYRIGVDYSVLQEMKLFAEGEIISKASATTALRKNRRQEVLQVAERPNGNPWNISLKAGADPNEFLLSWDFDDHDASYDILINGKLIDTHYGYKAHLQNGMVYSIPSQYVKGSNLRVDLRKGDDIYGIDMPVEQQIERIYVKQSKKKCKDPVLVCCTAEYSEGTENKYILVHIGTQVYRVSIPQSNWDQIGPLWLMESEDFIELQDFT